MSLSPFIKITIEREKVKPSHILLFSHLPRSRGVKFLKFDIILNFTKTISFIVKACKVLTISALKNKDSRLKNWGKFGAFGVKLGHLEIYTVQHLTAFAIYITEKKPFLGLETA